MAVDPGAERLGWAILEEGPHYEASGIYGLKRGDKEQYQKYKLRLIAYWVEAAPELFDKFKPEKFVSEIVPPTGFKNAAQSALSSVAVTVMQATAVTKQVEIDQVAATSAKKAMTGKGKATKGQVRKGVWNLIPQFQNREKNWEEEQWKAGAWDETDALAIGLTYLGYKNG